MGPGCLTAVFGMGTGVTPPVWSPEKWPAGVEAGPDTFGSGEVAHEATNRFHSDEWACSTTKMSNSLTGLHADRIAEGLPLVFNHQGVRQRPDRGGQAAWLLGPVG